MALDKSFLNVILLGFGFMFVFTAFQTMGNIEKTILDSIQNEDENFHGNAYTSLAIIYAVFAVCNWLVPSIISVTGPKIAMLFGAVTYLLFILSFLWPQTWLLYLASVVIGIGAAVIWTGQGNYLTMNSTPETISRNSGIFWAMLQASMFLGNLFVYFQFQGKTEIDKSTRTVVFLVLAAVAVVGIVFLLSLRPPPRQSSQTEYNVNSSETPESGNAGPLEALKGAIRLFITADMLLLSVTFFYTGIELSFFSGVYSASIGFTLEFGENVKQFVGLSGIFIGLGEVIGGAIFGILGSKTVRWGRDPIVIGGFIIHAISFFLIFLNIPNSASSADTHDVATINPPSVVVAMLCAFMLGFGDACYNTQIYSMLGGVFAHDSTSAFAIFKFIQSVAAATSFVYTSHVGMTVQLSILIVLAIVGTLTFVRVEWTMRRTVQEASSTESVAPDSSLMDAATVTSSAANSP